MKKLQVEYSMPTPSEDELKKFERNNRISLPAQFREFLLEQNTYIPKDNTFRHNSKFYVVQIFYPFFDGFEASLQTVYEQLYESFEGKFVAFAADPGGWQFVISLRKNDYGVVYFCRMDEQLPRALTYLASSFDQFIDNLIEESATI